MASAESALNGPSIQFAFFFWQKIHKEGEDELDENTAAFTGVVVGCNRRSAVGISFERFRQTNNQKIVKLVLATADPDHLWGVFKGNLELG